MSADSSTHGWKGVIWGVAALALLLGFNAIFAPELLSIQVKDGRLFGSLIDVVDRAAPVMLIALGMTLVIATGGVDLSVGAVMAVAGATLALLVAQADIHVGVAILAAIGAGLAAGIWNGGLVALFNIQPIVATLILMVAGRGVAQLISRGQIITFENDLLAFIGNGSLFGLPFNFTVVIVALLVIVMLTRLTALGVFVESIGGNETASRYAGINVRAVKWFTYAITGLLAGIAGVIQAADIKAADANNAGLYVELDAILAVVIGGTALTGGRFHLVGAIVGALIIQLLTTTILTVGIPVEYTLVVKALVVLGVCLLQSDSLRSSIWLRRSSRP